MSRTFLVNPTESQKRCYTALEASLAAGVAACVVDATLGHVFDAIVAVLSQTKDDAGKSLDTSMFKIVGFGIGYELREAPLLVQKDASFTLKQGCTIALYIGLENLVSKDVIKGLSTCSMQIGDTVVVGSSAPTVVTRDAMDTKLSSVVLAFNHEKSVDDAKVKESKKPKREAVKSAYAVSRKRATFDLSLDSAQEDIKPLHPANIRSVPDPGARVTLADLPKEQSHLNDLCATVLSITSAKSSSGATKVPLLIPPFIIFLLPPTMRGQSRLIVGQLLVKLDLDGKRVSIPESMCNKILNKLLVVDKKPIDVFIECHDPMYTGTLS
jgi:hypothetical protein